MFECALLRVTKCLRGLTAPFFQPINQSNMIKGSIIWQSDLNYLKLHPQKPYNKACEVLKHRFKNISSSLQEQTFFCSKAVTLRQTHTLSPFSNPTQTLIHSTQGLHRQLSNQNKSPKTEAERNREEHEAFWMCCQLAAADQWSERSWNRKDPEWSKQVCFHEVSDVDPELKVHLEVFQPLQTFVKD